MKSFLKLYYFIYDEIISEINVISGQKRKIIKISWLNI